MLLDEALARIADLERERDEAETETQRLADCWQAAHERAEELGREVARLTEVLEESVKLQTHYAELLNMHDGGQRRGFADAAAWIARLRETGTLLED